MSRHQLAHYLVKGEIQTALKPYSPKGQIDIELASAVAANVTQVIVNKHLKEVNMERTASTGVAVSAFTAIAAGILYFLKLPILSQTALSWLLVVAIVSAAALGASVVVRSIWDTD